MEDSWILFRTLGVKHKNFSWKIDDKCNITIKRKFKNELKYRIETVSNEHLNKLGKYMEEGDWKDLANNVEKLRKGTEKDGIGSFIYSLRADPSYAQLSSHLGAIFYHSGVWKWNGQKRGIKFLQNSDNWCEKITYYYHDSLKNME